MKKFNKFGYASAMLLATAMGFTGCSSDDEMENINPTFDGNSVKTQFAISLTQKANKGGRMANDHAMGQGATFQGLKNLKLYQFKGAVTDGTQASVKLSDLEDITGSNFNFKADAMNGHVYNNVEFVEGVDNFLFYAQANIDDATNEGKVTWNPASSGAAANTTTFTPVTFLANNSTVTNKKGQSFDEAFAGIVKMLNDIDDLFDAADAAGVVPPSVIAEQTVLQQATYASSDNIRELLQDIYFSIKTQSEGMAAGAADKTATETLMDAILSASSLVVDGTALAWDTNKNPEFPTKWGLPNGAVAVKRESGDFVINNVTSDGMKSDYTKFVYPAPLMFYANSPAGVRSASFFEGKTPANSDKWIANVQSQYAMGEVGPTTRSVILWNEIQYGVAQLATTVKFATATVKDSKGKDVTVPVDGFPVTGVLVGDQKAVDWKFEQAGAVAYTLFDGHMTNTITAKSTAVSATNYTLVYESAAAGETDVRVAIEMVNNTGKDFYGVGAQIIPAGGKFYMFATLEVPAVDPVTLSVFKQDYVTTANFVINSLKSAYNVIPDLSTPKMEFGMSVDLEWQAGLTFTATIE